MGRLFSASRPLSDHSRWQHEITEPKGRCSGNSVLLLTGESACLRPNSPPAKKIAKKACSPVDRRYNRESDSEWDCIHCTFLTLIDGEPREPELVPEFQAVISRFSLRLSQFIRLA